MFLGSFTPRLDDKGRLFLPAKYRDRLAGGIVLTRGQEGCLFGFPRETFEPLVMEMAKAPLTNAQARSHMRMFLANASDEIPDKQGRITIPAGLRDWAGLTHECTVVGAADRLEIWDTARWNAYDEANRETYNNRSEEVVPGIF
jgi:MraZ protein